jgi:hypothetical protein
MDTGSRDENASKQQPRASLLIQSEAKCSSQVLFIGWLFAIP